MEQTTHYLVKRVHEGKSRGCGRFATKGEALFYCENREATQHVNGKLVIFRVTTTTAVESR